MVESRQNIGSKIKTGVVMDPISGIKSYKDSTFAMLLEAQRRGHELLYMETADLSIKDGVAMGYMKKLSVMDDPEQPQALRDANEKCFITQFPQCCVPALITRSCAEIKDFVVKYGLSVVKPLDGMGGESIFQVRPDDPNLNVIIETITGHESEFVMVQRYIPEITQGDKRILVVNGEPVPYALARIPGDGDFRGNLAKGGTGKGIALTERDYWIVSQVAPELKRRGIVFAGLDVIGDWLTEINVTSPTCIRELDDEFGLNIAADLFDALESARQG
jgi:glutathione synthase